MKDKEKIALFIDADNAPAAKIDVILSELARYGVVNIRKAYGNRKSPCIKPWEDFLHEYAIQPIQHYWGRHDAIVSRNMNKVLTYILFLAWAVAYFFEWINQ